jgi:hypothetical protein
MCCVLLCVRWKPSMEGVRCCRRLEVVLYAIEMLEDVRRVLLCMLEAVGCALCA